MVTDGTSFKVVDQSTGEDLTHSILLQIIMELENKGKSLFDLDVLSEFIRNYSESNREYFSSFLQASIKQFNKQQVALISQMGNAFHEIPMDYWREMTEQSLEKIQEIQGNFFQSDVSDKSKE